MDKISVIIPSYNREKTLLRSINSVLNQSYKNIELIIIDDNSNDSTIEIIKKIKDNRLKYIKNEINMGACYSRNLGIEKSTGKYIAFQDSDDEWVKDKLEKQIKYLKENGYDIVSCYMKQIYDNKVEKNFPNKDVNLDNIKTTIYYDNIFSTQTILGKKECFIKNKFDNKLPRFQDWELMIRMCNMFKVGFVKENLVYAYIQNDSISKNNEKAVEALQRINKIHGINNNIKSFYYRNIAIYALQYDRNLAKESFINAYERNKNFKNIVNCILIKVPYILKKIYKIKRNL